MLHLDSSLKELSIETITKSIGVSMRYVHGVVEIVQETNIPSHNRASCETACTKFKFHHGVSFPKSTHVHGFVLFEHYTFFVCLFFICLSNEVRDFNGEGDSVDALACKPGV